MCKNRINKDKLSQVTSLAKHCPLLDQYIQDDRSQYSRVSINHSRFIFGLGPVETMEVRMSKGYEL